MPLILQAISDRLVRWNIVPAHRRPDSAIVNIYNEGDCIPPHIDHNNFLRPFVTISLLSESPISFGLNIKPHGPGEFEAPCHISLPRGSCLVLNVSHESVSELVDFDVLLYREMEQTKQSTVLQQSSKREFPSP